MADNQTQKFHFTTPLKAFCKIVDTGFFKKNAKKQKDRASKFSIDYISCTASEKNATNPAFTMRISQRISSTLNNRWRIYSRKLPLFPLFLFFFIMPVQAHDFVGPGSVSKLAKDLQDTVVNISTAVIQPIIKEKETPKIPKGAPFEDLFKDFFEGEGKSPKLVNSLGSGFVVDASGIIITNHHVIQDAEDIFITFSDGQKLKVVNILGTDEKTDIAVLKVNPPTPLKAVKIGNSKDIQVGDWVMAIGNPFGLGGSVSVGVVSAKDRNINAGPYDNFIQTDAAINKGNSGGPLFNMKGELIGINTAIISPSGGSIGIGFAVPSNLANHVIAQIVKYGEVKRGWLGVHLQSVSREIAESLGLKNGPRGALVAKVARGGPADIAGLQTGDVIIGFNNYPVMAMRELPRLIAGSKTNKPCKVDIIRNGKSLVRHVILREKSRIAEKNLKTPLPTPNTDDLPEDIVEDNGLLGMELKLLNKKLRKKHRLSSSQKGVLITRVLSGSPAGKKQIKPGQVIVEVGQMKITKPEEFRQKLAEARLNKRKSILLLITNRKGELRFVAVPLT